MRYLPDRILVCRKNSIVHRVVEVHLQLNQVLQLISSKKLHEILRF